MTQGSVWGGRCLRIATATTTTMITIILIIMLPLIITTFLRMIMMISVSIGIRTSIISIRRVLTSISTGMSIGISI